MTLIKTIFEITLFDRFLEGGVVFMSLILICLLMSIFFTIKSILKINSDKETSKKTLKHISDSGTLGLALGVMGAFLGLVSAFDVLEASVAAEPSIIAGGLKVALLSPLFGLFTFSVSKLAILILRIIQK